MEDIEWATERPGEHKFTVPGDGSVSSDAVGVLKTPVRDILATVRPKEMQADTVEHFVDAHVSSGRGCVIGGENISADGLWQNDEHA